MENGIRSEEADHLVVMEHPILIRKLENPSEETISLAIQNNIGLANEYMQSSVRMKAMAAINHPEDIRSKDNPDGSIPSVQELYERDGVSQEVMYRAYHLFSDFGADITGYDPAEKSFIISKYLDKHQFVHEWYPPDSFTYRISEHIGDGEPFDLDYQHSPDHDDMLKTLEALDNDQRVRFAKALVYERDADSEDFAVASADDITVVSADDLIDIVIKSSMRHELESATFAGLEYGAESAMYAGFEEFFNDMSAAVEWSFNGVEPDVILESDKPNGYKLLVDEEFVIYTTQLLEPDEDRDYYDDSISDWSEMVKFPEFEEPTYGWEGFEGDVAADYLAQDLSLY